MASLMANRLRQGESRSRGGHPAVEAADCKAYGTFIALSEPKALLADKSYDADAIQADLMSRDIQAAK